VAIGLTLALLVSLTYGGKKLGDDLPVLAPADPQYSYVSMNDPNASPQLGNGWYVLEGGSWRWMAREAHVLLRPLAGQANFELHFNLSRDHVATVGGPLQLDVLLNDRLLTEATYTTDGDYVLSSRVPPELLTPGTVHVTLRWSKAKPAGVAGDMRELGAIVQGVGFDSPRRHEE
jgi:hypothetical protein